MKSIRSKLMLLICVSVIIASFIIGILGVALTSNVINKDSNENMHLLCQVNADELDIIFAKTEDSVDTLAHFAVEELNSAESIKDYNYRQECSSKLKTSALHHIESTESALAVYAYYNPELIGTEDGFLFVKNGENATFTEHPISDLFNKDKNLGFNRWGNAKKDLSAVWLDSYFDEKEEFYVLSYVVPILKNDMLIGIIGADITTEHIEELVKGISLFSTGKAAVLKQDGTVIYHPNFEHGQIIGEDDPGFDGVVEKLQRNDKTLISYELDGVPKKIASTNLRNGMLIVCFAPVSEIYHDRNILSSYIVFITSIVTLIATIIAFFVSRRFAKPIKELNEAAKHMTDGEFEFNIKSISTDEIGELTETFLETRKLLKHRFSLLDAEAHRDGLTGIGNKSAFIDREKKLNLQISDGVADFAVAVLDVNKLKITNDVFGHMAGDRLLVSVANHLAAYFPINDIFRVGGDEFIIVLTENLSQCDAFVESVVAKMSSIGIEGYPECTVSCAFGTSRFNSHCDICFSDVLLRADKKMYNNKALTKKEKLPWQEGLKGLKQIQLEKYCELLKTLRTSTDDHLFLLNIETGVVQFFGDEHENYYIRNEKYSSSDIADVLDLVHANDRNFVQKTFISILNHESESIDINFRLQENDNVQWVNCRGSVIKEENNDHFVMIGRLSQNAIKHLYNPLTTLYNKNMLVSSIKKNKLKQFNCLMLLDVDNLSELNLNHGTLYGDNILKQLAIVLEKQFELWQIYHTEKNRFAILLNCDSSQEAKSVFAALKASLENICSISASVVPNDKNMYINTENIYDYAADLLNNAKKTSVGNAVFFSKETLIEKISEVELFEEVEHAVKNNFDSFYLVYQPQIRADEYSIFAAEALLRFNSKTKGPVYPDIFIPILEKTGLIDSVGLWVVKRALIQCKKWREFIPDFGISVNFSASQLKKSDIVAKILTMLEQLELPGSALTIEITESMQLEENDNVLFALNRLQKMGVKIAIDDFGTGYSNLGYLKKINADILKIDRIFVQDIKENGYNYNIIHNIIDFAKANSLKTCFEGVETVRELVVLSTLNSDYFQGYLFDKPCMPDELTAKYMDKSTPEFAERLKFVEQLTHEKNHAPLINMNTHALLQGIDVGLWSIRQNTETGEGELYTDSTMRQLLGAEDNLTPQEYYNFWCNNIKEKQHQNLSNMIIDMANSNSTIQTEYIWNHPKLGEVPIRCTGHCIKRWDDALVFEGLFRIIND